MVGLHSWALLCTFSPEDYFPHFVPGSCWDGVVLSWALSTWLHHSTPTFHETEHWHSAVEIQVGEGAAPPVVGWDGTAELQCQTWGRSTQPCHNAARANSVWEVKEPLLCIVRLVLTVFWQFDFTILFKIRIVWPSNGKLSGLIPKLYKFVSIRVEKGSTHRPNTVILRQTSKTGCQVVSAWQHLYNCSRADHTANNLLSMAKCRLKKQDWMLWSCENIQYIIIIIGKKRLKIKTSLYCIQST